ncbi:MAG TPA: hypothetical protein VK849_11325, partial [Longimicrobiales bacterium]|nr:hypothetical protein [Longimicrobiales bacterium]
VPGFRADARLYRRRTGRLRHPPAPPPGGGARAAVGGAVADVYGAAAPGPRGLAPEDAAEILLVAQWFRLRPEERRRTMSPGRWLEERRPA